MVGSGWLRTAYWIQQVCRARTAFDVTQAAKIAGLFPVRLSKNLRLQGCTRCILWTSRCQREMSSSFAMPAEAPLTSSRTKSPVSHRIFSSKSPFLDLGCWLQDTA